MGGWESFIVRDEERATPWLPEPLHAGLAFRLEHELFGKAAVRIGVEEDLDQYESAFEFAPAPDRCGLYYLLFDTSISAAKKILLGLCCAVGNSVVADFLLSFY